MWDIARRRGEVGMTAQFENARVIFTIGHELDTVKCQCGMEYFLFCVFRGDEGTPNTQIWPCDRVYFCPYCGAKNEELTPHPEQVTGEVVLPV